MSSRSHFLRILLGLLLCFGALRPLSAQFSQNPTTQNALRPSNSTDFLDLYQQSTSLKAMPEILAIFDASASMNSLMFHRLYVNNDLQDVDDYRWMSFTLTQQATTSIPLTNVYTITAVGKDTTNSCTSTATYTVTVTSSGTSSPTYSVTGSANTPSPGCGGSSSSTTPPTITLKAYASNCSSAYTTLVLTPVVGSGTSVTGANPYGNNPSYTIAASNCVNTGQKSGTPGYYTMENASRSSPSTGQTIVVTTPTTSTFAYNTTLNLSVFLAHNFAEGENETPDGNISWSTTNGSTPSGTMNYSTSPAIALAFSQSTATFKIPSWTYSAGSTGTPTTLHAITSSPASGATGFAVGATLNLSTYFTALTNSPGTVTWTVANTGGNSCAAGNITTTQASATTSSTSPSTATWTIPSYCAYTGSPTTTPAYVTVSLDPRVGSLYTAKGVTYLTSVLTATTDKSGGTAAGLLTATLRKPDGTAVQANYNSTTQTYTYDADASITGPSASPAAPSLAYTKYGHTDVRNWIRLASHVRLSTSVNGVQRTIDIPIPWNIPQPALTSSYTAFTDPLADQTIVDSETETTTVNGVSVTTKNGSNLNIPFDQTYKIENQAGSVFATDTNGTHMSASATTTAYLFGVVYRPAYISWLFTGTYGSTVGSLNNGNGGTGTPIGSLNYTTDSTLSGTSGKNFIVFDALIPNTTTPIPIVPGQTSATWGQAFGPSTTPWGTGSIKVPAFPAASGVQSGADQSIDPSKLAIPALTRFQAVKKAAITTWIQNQADVYFAFRELDPSSTEANSGSGTTFNNLSSTSLSSSTPTTTHLAGSDSGWTVLNNTAAQTTTTTTTTTSGNTVTVTSTSGNSVTGMTRIANMFATGDTPLTYAMARAMAQFSDPNSVFTAVEGSNVGQCLDSNLLLFTDGIDNNGIEGVFNSNASTPYFTPLGGTPTAFSAPTGNTLIMGNTGSIDRYGSYWNLFTYAGMGAHLSDSSLGTGHYLAAPRTSAGSGSMGNYPTGTQAPDQFLPLGIPSRGSVSFTADHQITTMTVGVSLGGSYTNPSSPKANLFYAAVAGNPSYSSGNFGTASGDFHAFVLPTGTYGVTSGINMWVPNDWVEKSTDPGDFPTIGQAAPGAVYFFDGSDPGNLSSAIAMAFKVAISNTSNHATANPNLPFVGASLGNEIYFGNFYPPSTGGVIWPGNLMMFATKSVNGVLSYVDQGGTATTTLDTTTAQWDTAKVLTNTLWTTRNLYTRYPATASSTGEPAIAKWPSWTSSAFTSGTDPIFTYVDPPTSTTGLANQQLVLEFAAGGDTSLGAMPATNRSSIMGDIINSVPAAVGYNLSQVKTGLAGYTSYGDLTNATGFNLVLVGTNQGWLHAFGEVTSKKTTSASTFTTGTVQELWAFMPTDFLNDLEYITQNSNGHMHMVDGSPAIYTLDLPSSTSSSGNGLVDNDERAVAIVSLGKGGRSYYALDIHNPFTPALLWSLVPDESDYFPSTRIVTGGPDLPTVKSILKNMGYSTCVPAFGRVQFNGVLHDCVFLGGGLSTAAVDANFTGAPHGLGRSVIALDVYSGAVLGAVDLTTSTIGGSTIGSIPAGVIPFEFISNSGMAQRAYFMDYNGGLWSWGSKNVSASTGYSGFRSDTAEMTNLPTSLPTGWTPWQVRKVFQDDNTGSSLGGVNNRYTTLPAPWMTSTFPGYAYHGDNVPAAVGIAMISGDRNNPLDRQYTSTTTPKQHQVTVVFDRQDSRNLGLDTASGPDTGIVPAGNLLVPLSETVLSSTPSNDLTDPVFSVFTKGSSNYYLGTSTAPRYGYYFLLPQIVNSTFVPKGINTPLVDANTLFYSFFTPTSSDPCTGGTGNSFSGTIADVMAPIYDDARSNIAFPSYGWIAGSSKAQWVGVASNFFAVGTTSVVQGGTVSTASGGTAMSLQSYQTTQSSLYPKVRVWRSVSTPTVTTP